MNDALLTQQHLADIGSGGDVGKDEIGIARGIGRRACSSRAFVDERLHDFRAPREHRQRMTGAHQVAHHIATHVAEADKCDFVRHCRVPLSKDQFRGISGAVQTRQIGDVLLGVSAAFTL